MRIKIKNLKIVLGNSKKKRLIIDDLDLEINTGEVVGLFGKSGCGKSSILNTISGLINHKGTIKFIPDSEQLKLSYVFQTPCLFPHINVMENLLLEEQNDVSREEIIHLLKGIDLNKKSEQLSLGMKQRVNIARAIANKPNVLLLDEPHQSLDQITARNVRQALKNYITSNKITTILVTHDAAEAAYMCNRVVLLDGTPAKIKYIYDTNTILTLPDALDYAEQIYTNLEEISH